MSDRTQPPRTSTEGVRPIPPPEELTAGQYKGWNCVWCGTPIPVGGRLVGISRGSMGAHHLDTEVYAGPCCP